MRLRGLIPAALVVLMPAQSPAQGWIEYASRADFFSVTFPGQPKVEEIAWISENEAKYPGRVYSVGDGRSYYAVTVVDYSDAERLNAERARNCPQDAQSACSGSATMGVERGLSTCRAPWRTRLRSSWCARAPG